MNKLTDEISKLKNNYDFEQVGFVFDSIIEGTTIAEVFADKLELPAISLVKRISYCKMKSICINILNKRSD